MSNVNHIELWGKCLGIIRDNIPEKQYDVWFSQIHSLGFEDGVIHLSVPSNFYIERLESTYSNLLRKTLEKVYGKDFRLIYHYDIIKDCPDSDVSIESQKDSVLLKNKTAKQITTLANPFSQPEVPDVDSRLNAGYTLENYCSSASNQLALSIGNAIATNPECKTFNPLLIFGSVGVGKTHLIQGIGIKIKEQDPSKRVLYTTARIFESQFTAASLKNNINDFINFYQSLDVLIIDDIQELSGKEKTQNTFYHIFNHLHLKQKQIIMSSDCPPVNLDGFMPRLMNRFSWGVTAELFSPDYDLRKKVLLKNSAQNGISIPEDVIEYIASNVTDSIRELEGIILSLLTRATYLKLPLSVDLAKAVVSNVVKLSKKQFNFEYLTEVVSDYFNLDSDLIYGKSRKREINDPRQIIMYLAKKYTKLSSTAIGLKLSRNHATVLYGWKTIEERLEYDKQLVNDIAQIEASLKK
ncbi:MAG: chromosomal replication initiator protein DnaA [Muribaculaceae bacterium]|nr:chromosomal replication initiator protein DnaA [Muribaculaceae bacterium]